MTSSSPTSSTSTPTNRTFPSTTFSITIPPNNLSSSDPSRRTEIIDSPRRKRHASLDGGHFRCRSMSSRESSVYVSPLGSSYGNDAKAINFGAKSLPPSPFEERPRRRSWIKERRSITKLVVGIAGILLLGAMATRGSLEGTEWWGARNALEIFIGSDVETPLACKNPYAELGRITVDQQNPEKNTWKPYDPACIAPPFLATLRKALRTRSTGSDEPLPLTLPLPPRKAAASSLPLPWLHGKTVLLFGDHVERNHNKDFCRLSGGHFETISRNHFLSPPRFVNGIDEKLQNANQENFDGSRPAVCYIPEYDFTIISVFHFGLANRVEFERESLLEDPAFYPPVALEDRLTHIVLPVLDSLNRTQPDLIEFSTGFWDLRHFTALDKLSGQDPSLELSPEQLSWYSERLTRAFADLADAFPHTPLLWRTMHQTPEFIDTPPARVAALDALSRQIVKLLNEAETVGEARVKIDSLMEPDDAISMRRPRHEGRSRRKTFRDRANSRARFLNKVKQRIGSTERMHDVVFGNDDTSLKQLITVDEWGTLMRGQEHSANKIYTPALPGGYLWSDMMLFFLHRLSAAPHFRF